MSRFRLFACAVVGLIVARGDAALAAESPEAHVRKILSRTPLLDGHNDLASVIREKLGGDPAKLDLKADQSAAPLSLQTDIPRLRRGGIGGQFWSVFVPSTLIGAEAPQAVLEQMDIVRQVVARYPEVFELAASAEDIVRIHRAGRIASLMGMEGGHSINNSLQVLREMYRAGARYMTLTHSTNVDWADSCSDKPRHDGLTRFGEAVVREMNRLGMLVDLSHVAESTMEDALRVSEAPVIFSHSSARAVTDHVRNVPDTILRELPRNGGVVMVTFVGSFVSKSVHEWSGAKDAERDRLKALYPNDPSAVDRALDAWRAAHPAPRATVADVADHIEHVRRVAGIDHVGLGGDFDGTTLVPVGLDGVDGYPTLLAELLRRGWSDADIRKLGGENVLRVMRTVERVAARLQRERAPSNATIQEVDPDYLLPDALRNRTDKIWMNTR